jgi:broad specificity phosphatase PhoE
MQLRDKAIVVTGGASGIQEKIGGGLVSVLALVRHSQASFFSDDYDRLSPEGEAQSRLLGEYWARQGEAFSEVYVGPRRRQHQTAELVGAQYRRAGLPWPEPVVLAELDEYDLAGLLDRLAPALARRDRRFEHMLDAYRRSKGAGESERARTFQRMFGMLLTHWLSAPADAVAEGVESWPAFRDRVGRGLDRITERPARRQRVAAFTSGGFIGAAVARALEAPDRAALELSWRLRNASLTHLVFTTGRLTLDDFNTIPHLTDPTHWTYR